MKRIVIITDRERIAEKIREDLLFVFRGKAEIEILTFDIIENKTVVDGDILLFTLGDRIERIKDKIVQSDNILLVKRTLREKNLVKLFELPQDTPVLVVNDNYENTLQTVSLLYDLNIDNLKLKPFHEENYDKSIDIAVTPGEVDKVPAHISQIIDIGDRCVDLTTFMDIICRLNIGDEEVSKRLLRYSNEIVNSNKGVNQYYKDAIMRNVQMEHILEASDMGVLLTSPDGRILLCNRKFCELADVQVKERVSCLEEVFEKNVLDELTRNDLKTGHVLIQGKEIVFTKSQLDYSGGVFQDLYFFRDVTYIKSLEQTLSGKVRAKGFVARYHIDDIVYQSERMKNCLESVRIFAQTDKTVLIEGESGTGKELLAQSIHNLSDRKIYPFVAINCAAMPASLLESELFGYVKGAFTGASRDGKPGLFEQADHGTIFLDEIGDMPFELQSRLLRVIQEKQVLRIGSDKVIDIDVRIIAATNRDLTKEISDGHFRSDLYYRIGVLPIHVPPLRERKEDILPLFLHFLNRTTDIPEGIKRNCFYIPGLEIFENFGTRQSTMN